MSFFALPSTPGVQIAKGPPRNSSKRVSFRSLLKHRNFRAAKPQDYQLSELYTEVKMLRWQCAQRPVAVAKLQILVMVCDQINLHVAEC